MLKKKQKNCNFQFLKDILFNKAVLRNNITPANRKMKGDNQLQIHNGIIPGAVVIFICFII